MCKECEFLCFSFWVYGFPLGLCFSFGSMFFLWLYGFPLGLCFSFGYMVRRDMEQERCALHKGPERRSGNKMRFSPPPPLCLAEGSQLEVNRDSRITEID